ncbi:unnamed protein product [Effrenium voratum]|uniref:Uncharacterized protein n=1 Tax=Effrenium voratum TaxID=2562239 RepID=A0AA36JLM9_9DINO|nr:unnamed protein product [Effrenium voratum]
MTSASSELSQQLRAGSGRRRAPAPAPSTQSPEDVVRMLLLAAPDAGRPPPEIVGAALKAAGVQANDQNLIRALQEAAGARGGNPSREDLLRARSGAQEYIVPAREPDSGSEGSLPERPMPEIKYQSPSTPAITFNNALAQMKKKPIQAMRLLESMRASMPDVAALRGSFTLPTSAEDVVKTLCQVAPDAGRPPPEVVGAALKAAGLPATEENLQKALQEAFARTPSKEEIMTAKLAAEQYSTVPSGGYVEADLATGASSSPMPLRARNNDVKPEDIIEALLQAAPGLGQPPPEVVGMALRQAGVAVTEETVVRALRAAGDDHPSTNSIRIAWAAAQDEE